MFYGGAIGLGKYDGDFQYLYVLSEREGVPPPSVFLCIPPLFNFFSGIELELCLLSECVKILIKW